jgi:hypothetical protein
MRPERMGNIRQKPRRCVTRRLDDVALEMREGTSHQRVPGVVIACLCGMLQQDKVAYRLNGHQAETAGESFILGDRDVLRGHVLSQAWGFCLRVSDHRFFHPAIDPLLCAKGGAHKPIEPRHLQPETDQANTARTNFATHDMERHDQAVEEGEPRDALTELDHLGTGIEPILPRPPRLQRGARHLQPLGGLPLGQPCGLQVTILPKEFGALEAIPALVTIFMAALLLIDDSAHSSLLTSPLAGSNLMG